MIVEYIANTQKKLKQTYLQLLCSCVRFNTVISETQIWREWHLSVCGWPMNRQLCV